MKPVLLLIKILLALFLGVCILVHVLGFFMHVSNEPVWSHIAHLISYTLCLVTLVSNRIKPRMLLYLAGMVYPVFYHGRCFWQHWQQTHTFNGICFSVIFLLPLAALLIYIGQKKQLL